MDLIKLLIKELVKMYNEYVNFLNMGNMYFKPIVIFNFLKKQYNIDIELGDLVFIINHYNNNDKLFKHDLSIKDLELLNLYDLKYLGDYYFRISIKTIINNKSIKKTPINYIIVNYKGGDKQYNIVLFKYKKDYLTLNNYLNKTDKIKNDKKRSFYKNHKYNYSKCKNKTFRRGEIKLISNKKYSHNFKKSYVTNKYNNSKYGELQKTHDLLYLVLTSYYTNKDLLNIYVNSFNINNHIVNTDNIINNLIDNMERVFNRYKKNNKDIDYITFKYMNNNKKVLISFLEDLKEYKAIMEREEDLYNKKTIINDYY